MNNTPAQTTGSDRLEKALITFINDDEDYTFIKDTDFVYLVASEAFATMVGQPSAKDIVGKTDYDLFEKDLADKYRHDDTLVLGGKPIEGIVERIPEKDGKERWTQTWKRSIHDEDGTLIGLYGIGRDITHVIGLESEAETARKYTDLLNNIPGGVAIFHVKDDEFFLDYANNGWYDIHHIGRKAGRAFLGSGIMSCVLEPDRRIVIDEHQRMMDQGDAFGNVTFRVVGEDRQIHWVNMQFRYAYSEEGIRYYYSSYSDLDEQKTAEENLRESQTALDEAVAYSDIQFFTYLPKAKRCEIYALNDRFSKLPTIWENFPESFLSYTKVSPEDMRAYCDMIQRIDEGAEDAECTVRFDYHGAFIWERVRIKSVQDEYGRTTKALGYSTNVTDRKNAEDRLQRERVRLKSLEGNVFEAFSFNLSKSSQPEIQSSDRRMLETVVNDAMIDEAVRVSPLLAGARPETREVLLRAASRIPDTAEREAFIATCSGNALRKAASEGRYSAEIRYRRYIGDVIRWVSTNAEILPDPESGDLIAFYYTEDVNDEVVQEKLASQIIRTNYVAVSYIDLQTGLFIVKTSTDPHLMEYDGKPFRELVTHAFKDAFLPAEVDETVENFSLEKIIDGLENTPVYTFYYSRHSTDESTQDTIRHMRNDLLYLDEHKDMIVCILSDVTGVFEQERVNREKMARALAAAEQASIAKTEFLSRMSHEIRTPMNAIIGLDAIALQEQGISSAMEDHLQKIGISARFLLSLINDILDMSRIESGMMVLKKEPFDFEELINSINTILYEQCKDSGIEYECVLKSFTEETYVGDVTKLQQVLVNILGNAVKFTPTGGKIHFMIEQVSRTKEKACLKFEISDTGIGIDEKYLPHLFEPFSQENRGRTSAYGGTGLGLAISKNIVNLMDGDISVHSIKNIGSEFSVQVELGIPKVASHRQRGRSNNMRKLFTLIVDDDIIICQHTQAVLDGAGFDAEWVDSGMDAVAKVTDQHRRKKDYDLILLDWQMPGMNGIETAERIRKIVGPDVTIIIMTAYDWADIEEKAKAAGIDMFVKKPVFAPTITKAYENVLMSKRHDEPEKTVEYDFTGKRILLAEDNEINAEIARSILEIRNCAVEIAGNGAEAVESFASAPVGHFDAILMDVRMPVMDGLEATKTIRAMRKAESKTIPIIAMTANAFQEDVNLSLESGMNAHLAKPIEPRTLYETLDRFMNAPSPTNEG